MIDNPPQDIQNAFAAVVSRHICFLTHPFILHVYIPASPMVILAVLQISTVLYPKATDTIFNWLTKPLQYPTSPALP